MPQVRAAGFAAVTVPAVALAHLAVTGGLPPAGLLPLVALLGAVIGWTAGWTAGNAGTVRTLASLAVAQLAGHAVLYLALGRPPSGCLPLMGRGARVGADLALLRPDAACGPGRATAGAGLLAAVAVLLVAVTVLAGQLLAAAAGTLLLRAVEAAWTALRALAAFVLPRLPRPIVVTTVPRLRPELRILAPVPAPVSAAPLLRRGPPAAVLG